jgi:hypothetical protein
MDGIEHRRDKNRDEEGLAGLIRSVSLSGYPHLFDGSAYLMRPGKPRLPDNIPVMETLPTSLSIEFKDELFVNFLNLSNQFCLRIIDARHKFFLAEFCFRFVGLIVLSNECRNQNLMRP